MGWFDKFDSDSERDQYYHNLGESDASKGEYNKPNNDLEQIIFSDRASKDNESYDAGHDNTSDQKSESSGGCYITTACVNYYGLSDDCKELQTLRMFRDKYLLSNPETLAMVKEYYRTAPALVTKMINDCNASQIFAEVFQSVKNIVALVDSKRFNEAVESYRAMYNKLIEKVK